MAPIFQVTYPTQQLEDSQPSMLKEAFEQRLAPPPGTARWKGKVLLGRGLPEGCRCPP